MKVGGGKWTDLVLKWGEVAAMSRGALLKALKADELFSLKLQGVALDDCSVFILKGDLPATQRLPTDVQERDAVELEADLTVEDVVMEGGCAGKRLFIHVQLPPPQGTGAASAGEYALDGPAG